MCPAHFICAVALEQGVPARMRLIACVANHEEQFRKAMGTKQKALSDSRLTFPMTLWEYSPRLC